MPPLPPPYRAGYATERNKPRWPYADWCLEKRRNLGGSRNGSWRSWFAKCQSEQLLSQQTTEDQAQSFLEKKVDDQPEPAGQHEVVHERRIMERQAIGLNNSFP